MARIVERVEEAGIIQDRTLERQFSTERLLFPDEVEAYEAGEWIRVHDEPHEEVWGVYSPRKVTVIGREVCKIGAGYEAQKVYVLGDLEPDSDPHLGKTNTRTRISAETSLSGQVEIRVFRIVKVTNLQVIDIQQTTA